MDMIEGTMEHALPFYSFGAGEPLVVLRWFTVDHANPHGLERHAELRVLSPLAAHREVFAINRAPDMPAGTTMSDIAREHAEALDAFFGKPVDVLGMSSGGSLALQLAAEHPRVVRRLVIAGAAYTLTEQTRDAQRDYTAAIAAGKRGAHHQVPITVRNPLLQTLLTPILWLSDPLLRPENPLDMLHFAQAEDTFDVADRLATITAPTLVIGGADDLAYTPELFQATADGIPGGRLISYPGTGHMSTFSSKRFATDILEFLDAPGSGADEVD
ncbi:alpha/beta fold hydrolase [Antrihabitans sp. YC2-6]|uniref:alpha/beta fold hydrolase n=1 Tax=Antrihabitans sp. YC2-6 TaxID=2799498 RepID=UPI0018F42BC9|nr:alpha/beta fold hydrolase [Antrihabitans sp. YC2-6]MBJ8345840.1 alpha/beta fold hydrolase [Antrihabitans sp. YC2-6]